MEKEEFKILSDKEAGVLETIADATMMDAWFRIDEDLHVYDGEGDLAGASEAELVCLLEDGLAYGLDEPQCGSLSPEDEAIARACFKRARIHLLNERIESLEAALQKLKAANKDPKLIADVTAEIQNKKDELAKLTLPHVKLTLESMASWEDWETVCHMAGVDPKKTTSVTLYVAKTDVVEDEAASGRHTGLTVKATVTFQRWEGDVARFNGETEFDACDALDSLDDEMITLIERGDPNAYDAVYYAAVSLGQIHSYDGPFEVDLDEDNLSDYLEARRNG